MCVHSNNSPGVGSKMSTKNVLIYVSVLPLIGSFPTTIYTNSYSVMLASIGSGGSGGIVREKLKGIPLC